MWLHNRDKSAGLRRKALGFLALGAVSAGGFLASGMSAAQAEQSPGYTTLVPASSWLDIAVSGGSTMIGAPIIQWWADGGAEQQWSIPDSYATGDIINENSGMCITTDGVAGDGLFQEPCSQQPGVGWYNNQQWHANYQYLGPTVYTNPA